MSMYPTRALAPLDAEVARLARPRVWSEVQAAWVDEPALRAGSIRELLDRLRGSGAETDPLAQRLVALAAADDHDALTVLLAALAGVFVTTSRRQGVDIDMSVADQLSLTAEVLQTTELPSVHVLSVLVSRVQARHRRLRHRVRFVGGGGDALVGVAGPDDPAGRAVARVTLGQLGEAIGREVRRGTFTQADWRRLVELRIHERPSGEIGRRDAMSAAGVRKRVQRTAAALAVVSDAA